MRCLAHVRRGSVSDRRPGSGPCPSWTTTCFWSRPPDSLSGLQRCGGSFFVGAASCRDDRGWKPLPQKYRVRDRSDGAKRLKKIFMKPYAL
jgi:hypothetical protein